LINALKRLRAYTRLFIQGVFSVGS
jgi:hypothetical protein